MSRRSYYFNSINNFILEDEESVLGQLLINDEFETTDLQKMAWRSEIQILKKQLIEFSQGDIIFEYTIPRMGHRVDVICIIEGIIFLLEFKVGDKECKKTTTDQVMDYALDLKLFQQKRQRNRMNITVWQIIFITLFFVMKIILAVLFEKSFRGLMIRRYLHWSG